MFSRLEQYLLAPPKYTTPSITDPSGFHLSVNLDKEISFDDEITFQSRNHMIRQQISGAQSLLLKSETRQYEFNYGGYFLQAWYDKEKILTDFCVALGADLDLPTREKIIEIAYCINPQYIDQFLNIIGSYQPVLTVSPDDAILMIEPGNPLLGFNSDISSFYPFSRFGGYDLTANPSEYVMIPIYFSSRNNGKFIVTPRVGFNINRAGLTSMSQMPSIIEKMILLGTDEYLRQFINPYLRVDLKWEEDR